MSKHTPTPWVEKIEQIGDGRKYAYIVSDNGECVVNAGALNLNDAEFICRAVNAHEELLAALEALTTEGENVNCGKSPGHDLRVSLATARAAIAKAKGEA